MTTVEELRQLSEEARVRKEHKEYNDYKQSVIKKIDKTYKKLSNFAKQGYDSVYVVYINQKNYNEITKKITEKKNNVLKELANTNKYPIPLVYIEGSLHFKW
jgi:uncharacterized linocin/CFP29 family protein